MIVSLISFLESELGRDNPLVAFLLGISSTVGPGAMSAYSSIFALCVWSAFTYVLIAKRAGAVGSGLVDYSKAHLGKLSMEFIIGSVLVYTFFWTPYLFEMFGGLKEYFSDGDGQSSGLKFLFGYDTWSWWYRTYLTGAVLLWSLCLIRGAYAGLMYYVVFKGEAIVAGRTTSYLTQFKSFSTVLAAVTVICFSTAPEGLVNLGLKPFWTTIHEIVTGK